MIEDYFKILQKFIINDKGILSEDIIISKETELECKFPKSLIEFYKYYGLNDEVLASYYVFNKIEDLKIEEDALIFGNTHQDMSLLGIKKEKLGSENPPVNKYITGLNGWYNECIFSDSFFFNSACWQILNIMPSMAKININEKFFNSLCEDKIVPICTNKAMKKGYDVISCQNKKNNVLICFLREAEELYFGALEDRDLEDFENEIEEDFDWL